MEPYTFTKNILDGDTIDINNNGDMWRDFTHVDDIVEGVVRIAGVVPEEIQSRKLKLAHQLLVQRHILFIILATVHP